jgi:hypothetical protein
VGAALMTAFDAKWAVAEEVPIVLASEWIKKDIRCIKYEMKKAK